MDIRSEMRYSTSLRERYNWVVGQTRCQYFNNKHRWLRCLKAVRLESLAPFLKSKNVILPSRQGPHQSSEIEMVVDDTMDTPTQTTIQYAEQNIQNEALPWQIHRPQAPCSGNHLSLSSQHDGELTSFQLQTPCTRSHPKRRSWDQAKDKCLRKSKR